MSSDFDGHTPAPWHINKAIGGIWIMAGPIHVATIPRAGDGDWSPVNASLIAAAPDLLAERDRLAETVEELVEALLWYGEQARLARLIHSEGDEGRRALAFDGGDRARAALAKARGQA